MPNHCKNSRIEVDPLDLEGKTTDQCIALALEAVTVNGFRPNGRPWLSLCEAAAAYNISKTTLTARFNGRQTRKQAHEQEKTLSLAAEQVLVEWIIQMGRRGIPLHASAVAAHASVISDQRIGEHWVQRFRANHPELKTKWTTGLEKC